jgi:hypothetical protein
MAIIMSSTTDNTTDRVIGSTDGLMFHADGTDILMINSDGLMSILMVYY